MFVDYANKIIVSFRSVIIIVFSILLQSVCTCFVIVVKINKVWLSQCW